MLTCSPAVASTMLLEARNVSFGIQNGGGMCPLCHFLDLPMTGVISGVQEVAKFMKTSLCLLHV